MHQSLRLWCLVLLLISAACKAFDAEHYIRCVYKTPATGVVTINCLDPTTADGLCRYDKGEKQLPSGQTFISQDACTKYNAAYLCVRFVGSMPQYECVIDHNACTMGYVLALTYESLSLSPSALDKCNRALKPIQDSTVQFWVRCIGIKSDVVPLPICRKFEEGCHFSQFERQLAEIQSPVGQNFMSEVECKNFASAHLCYSTSSAALVPSYQCILDTTGCPKHMTTLRVFESSVGTGMALENCQEHVGFVDKEPHHKCWDKVLRKAFCRPASIGCQENVEIRLLEGQTMNKDQCAVVEIIKRCVSRTKFGAAQCVPLSSDCGSDAEVYPPNKLYVDVASCESALAYNYAILCYFQSTQTYRCVGTVKDCEEPNSVIDWFKSIDSLVTSPTHSSALCLARQNTVSTGGHLLCWDLLKLEPICRPELAGCWTPYEKALGTPFMLRSACDAELPVKLCTSSLLGDYSKPRCTLTPATDCTGVWTPHATAAYRTMKACYADYSAYFLCYQASTQTYECLLNPGDCVQPGVIVDKYKSAGTDQRALDACNGRKALINSQPHDICWNVANEASTCRPSDVGCLTGIEVKVDEQLNIGDCVAYAPVRRCISTATDKWIHNACIMRLQPCPSSTPAQYPPTVFYRSILECEVTKKLSVVGLCYAVYDSALEPRLSCVTNPDDCPSPSRFLQVFKSAHDETPTAQKQCDDRVNELVNVVKHVQCWSFNLRTAICRPKDFGCLPFFEKSTTNGDFVDLNACKAFKPVKRCLKSTAGSYAAPVCLPIIDRCPAEFPEQTSIYYLTIDNCLNDYLDAVLCYFPFTNSPLPFYDCLSGVSTGGCPSPAVMLKWFTAIPSLEGTTTAMSKCSDEKALVIHDKCWDAGADMAYCRPMKAGCFASSEVALFDAASKNFKMTECMSYKPIMRCAHKTILSAVPKCLIRLAAADCPTDHELSPVADPHFSSVKECEEKYVLVTLCYAIDIQGRPTYTCPVGFDVCKGANRRAMQYFRGYDGLVQPVIDRCQQAAGVLDGGNHVKCWSASKQESYCRPESVSCLGDEGPVAQPNGAPPTLANCLSLPPVQRCIMIDDTIQLAPICISRAIACPPERRQYPVNTFYPSVQECDPSYNAALQCYHPFSTTPSALPTVIECLSEAQLCKVPSVVMKWFHSSSDQALTSVKKCENDREDVPFVMCWGKAQKEAYCRPQSVGCFTGYEVLIDDFPAVRLANCLAQKPVRRCAKPTTGIYGPALCIPRTEDCGVGYSQHPTTSDFFSSVDECYNSYFVYLMCYQPMLGVVTTAKCVPDSEGCQAPGVIVSWHAGSTLGAAKTACDNDAMDSGKVVYKKCWSKVHQDAYCRPTDCLSGAEVPLYAGLKNLGDCMAYPSVMRCSRADTEPIYKPAMCVSRLETSCPVGFSPEPLNADGSTVFFESIAKCRENYNAEILCYWPSKYSTVATDRSAIFDCVDGETGCPADAVPLQWFKSASKIPGADAKALCGIRKLSLPNSPHVLCWPDVRTGPRVPVCRPESYGCLPEIEHRVKLFADGVESCRREKPIKRCAKVTSRSDLILQIEKPICIHRDGTCPTDFEEHSFPFRAYNSVEECEADYTVRILCYNTVSTTLEGTYSCVEKPEECKGPSKVQISWYRSGLPLTAGTKPFAQRDCENEADNIPDNSQHILCWMTSQLRPFCRPESLGCFATFEARIYPSSSWPGYAICKQQRIIKRCADMDTGASSCELSVDRCPENMIQNPLDLYETVEQCAAVTSSEGSDFSTMCYLASSPSDNPIYECTGGMQCNPLHQKLLIKHFRSAAGEGTSASAKCSEGITAMKDVPHRKCFSSHLGYAICRPNSVTCFAAFETELEANIPNRDACLNTVPVYQRCVYSYPERPYKPFVCIARNLRCPENFDVNPTSLYVTRSDCMIAGSPIVLCYTYDRGTSAPVYECVPPKECEGLGQTQLRWWIDPTTAPCTTLLNNLRSAEHVKCWSQSVGAAVCRPKSFGCFPDTEKQVGPPFPSIDLCSTDKPVKVCVKVDAVSFEQPRCIVKSEQCPIGFIQKIYGPPATELLYHTVTACVGDIKIALMCYNAFADADRPIYNCVDTPGECSLQSDRKPFRFFFSSSMDGRQAKDQCVKAMDDVKLEKHVKCWSSHLKRSICRHISVNCYEAFESSFGIEHSSLDVCVNFPMIKRCIKRDNPAIEDALCLARYEDCPVGYEAPAGANLYTDIKKCKPDYTSAVLCYNELEKDPAYTCLENTALCPATQSLVRRFESFVDEPDNAMVKCSREKAAITVRPHFQCWSNSLDKPICRPVELSECNVAYETLIPNTRTDPAHLNFASCALAKPFKRCVSTKPEYSPAICQFIHLDCPDDHMEYGRYPTRMECVDDFQVDLLCYVIEHTARDPAYECISALTTGNCPAGMFALSWYKSRTGEVLGTANAQCLAAIPPMADKRHILCWSDTLKTTVCRPRDYSTDCPENERRASSKTFTSLESCKDERAVRRCVSKTRTVYLPPVCQSDSCPSDVMAPSGTVLFRTPERCMEDYNVFVLCYEPLPQTSTPTYKCVNMRANEDCDLPVYRILWFDSIGASLPTAESQCNEKKTDPATSSVKFIMCYDAVAQIGYCRPSTIPCDPRNEEKVEIAQFTTQQACIDYEPVKRCIPNPDFKYTTPVCTYRHIDCPDGYFIGQNSDNPRYYKSGAQCAAETKAFIRCFNPSTLTHVCTEQPSCSLPNRMEPFNIKFHLKSHCEILKYNHRYTRVHARKTWTAASNYCKETFIGGSLAVFYGQDEVENLQASLGANFTALGATKFWIGAFQTSQAPASAYQWSDSRPFAPATWLPWGVDEPNPNGDVLACISYFYTTPTASPVLLRESCTKERQFICMYWGGFSS